MAQYHGRKSTVTRFKDSRIVELTDTLGTTPAVDFQGKTIVSLRSPDEAVGTVTFYAAGAEDGAYTAIQVDSTDVVVTLSGTKWNNVDPSVSAHRWIKMVADADGDIEINQLG